MKNTGILILVFISMIILSCNKENGSGPALPCRITGEGITPINCAYCVDTETYKSTYLYKGIFIEKVIKNYYSNGINIQNFTTDSFTFYENGYPAERYILISPSEIVHYVYSYNNNKIKEISKSFFIGGFLYDSEKMNYDYDSAGQLITSISSPNYYIGEDHFIISRYTFDQNNNLTQLEVSKQYSLSPANDPSALTTAYEFSDYDKNTNLFYNMFWNDNYSIYSFSRNNFGKVIIYNTPGATFIATDTVNAIRKNDYIQWMGKYFSYGWFSISCD